MTTLISQSLRLTLIYTLLLGAAYPLLVTGVAQLAFHRQANGSLAEHNGQVVGSTLLAQKFASPRYFWPRPSAGDFATIPSGASNLGPTSQALQSNVNAYAVAFRATNQLPASFAIPGDMLFTSGSGLDPHISPVSAHLQVVRVAAARGLKSEQVETLLAKLVEPSQGGFMGEPRVNVLQLNQALDSL